MGKTKPKKTNEAKNTSAHTSKRRKRGRIQVRYGRSVRACTEAVAQAAQLDSEEENEAIRTSSGDEETSDSDEETMMEWQTVQADVAHIKDAVTGDSFAQTVQEAIKTAIGEYLATRDFKEAIVTAVKDALTDDAITSAMAVAVSDELQRKKGDTAAVTTTAGASGSSLTAAALLPVSTMVRHVDVAIWVY